MTSHDELESSTRAETPNNAGWATFEARVRGKRFARCIDRANAAILHAQIAAAREAIAEARALSPMAPEIAQLEARLDAVASNADGANTRELTPVDPQALERDPGWLGVAGAMAALLLLFSIFGFGLVQLYFTAPAQTLIGAADVDNSPAGADPGAIAGGAADTAEAAGSEPGQSEIAASATSPSVSLPAAALPPDTEPPSPDGAIGTNGQSDAPQEPGATTAAALRRNAGSGAPTARSSGSEIPAPRPWRWRQPPTATPASATIPDGPLPESPFATGSNDIDPVPVPSTSSFSAPEAAVTAGVMRTSATAAGPSPVDVSPEEARRLESARIRALLLRYENAYNRLDANAALALWPGAGRDTLSRAFDDLNSQRVSLGLCDITVIGDIGGASCIGKARWEPRAGSGLQTADRQWTFNLRKIAGEWRIEQIRVRDLDS
jgi:hypothetical protein